MVSMYVCMYACMYVCMLACMHACMYACTLRGQARLKLRGSRFAGDEGSDLARAAARGHFAAATAHLGALGTWQRRISAHCADFGSL